MDIQSSILPPRTFSISSLIVDKESCLSSATSIPCRECLRFDLLEECSKRECCVRAFTEK